MKNTNYYEGDKLLETFVPMSTSQSLHIAWEMAPATGCLIGNNLATNGAGGGKSGYNFAATADAGAGSPNPNEFYTATPIRPQTGTKAYCVFDDGVVRQQAPGVIALVGGYGACQALLPLRN